MSDPYTVKALSPIGQVIAARMSEAKRNIPHFRLSVDIELDALIRLRQNFSRNIRT